MQLSQYSLIIVAVISALNKVGINTTAILTSLGVVGLTVGFAAKDTLSNIMSGLFIFWDRPFVLEDLVEIGGGSYGQVDSITLRSTRIITPDGKMLSIPNTTVVNEKVVSYTNFPNLRLDIKVTIGSGEDINKVRKILIDLVKDDDRYLKEKPAVLVLSSINDYNIEVEFRVWLKNEKNHISRRFELREKVFKTLVDNNIEMPLETIQLSPFEHYSKN